MSSSNTQSTSLSDIGRFYKQINDFKEKLVTILSQFNKDDEITTLHKYYDKLIILKKINPRSPIEIFYEHIVQPFATQILTRNDEFFLGKLTSDNIMETFQNVANDEITPHNILLISHIRDIWTELHPNIKKNIWDYVQIICLLAEKVTNNNILSSTRLLLIKNGILK